MTFLLLTTILSRNRKLNTEMHKPMFYVTYITRFCWLVGWLYFTSHRQRGHLETAPPFTVPCEGREARCLHRSQRESNTAPSRGSPLQYRCATQAPQHYFNLFVDIKLF